MKNYDFCLFYLFYSILFHSFIHFFFGGGGGDGYTLLCTMC